MSKNFYDVLGIHSSASADEIKRAYHTIARQHHPDRSKNGDIDLFKQATLAYETLRDKELRQTYDQKFMFTHIHEQMRFPHAPRPESQRFYQRRPQSTHFSTAYSTPYSTASDSYMRNTGSYEERTYASFAQPQSYVRRSQSAKEAAARAAFAKHGQAEFQSSYFSDPKIKLKRSGKSRNPYRSASIRTDYGSSSPEESPAGSPQEFPEAEEDGTQTKGQEPPLVKDPEIVDLTEEDSEEPKSEEAEPRKHENDSTPHTSRKRTAHEDESGEPSPKRARFFDFSEFKKVPPFTEKHGSSFTFPDFNDLLREDMPTDRAQTRSEINYRAQMLLTKYTMEGNAAFEELFQLQNQRVQLIQLPGAPVHLMKQNLLATEKLLSVLLGGTRNVLREA